MKRLVLDDIVMNNVGWMELDKIKLIKEENISSTSRVKDSRTEVGLANAFLKKVDPIASIRGAYAMLNFGDNVAGNISLAPNMVKTVPITYIRLLKALGRCSITPSLQFSEVVNQAFMTIMKDLLESNNIGEKHSSEELIDPSPYKVIIWDAIMEFYAEVSTHSIKQVNTKK